MLYTQYQLALAIQARNSSWKVLRLIYNLSKFMKITNMIGATIHTVYEISGHDRDKASVLLEISESSVVFLSSTDCCELLVCATPYFLRSPELNPSRLRAISMARNCILGTEK